MSRLVNVSITGGLGNQMFQVATCLSYAWKHGMKPIFLKGEWIGMASHPGTHWETFLFRLKEFLVDALPQNIRNYYPEKWDYAPIPNPTELSTPSGNIRLNGYFQSDKHFSEHSKQIVELFRPSDECISKLTIKYHHINFDEAGILHIRRGDYLNLKNIHTPLPIDYYKEAIRVVEEKAGRPLKWFIISESSSYEWIKDQEIFKDFVIVTNDFDYEDLGFMTFFKYFVIANSTFSWWGAFLSQKEEKVVAMPNNWFGPEGPNPHEGIYPEGWIRV